MKLNNLLTKLIVFGVIVTFISACSDDDNPTKTSNSNPVESVTLSFYDDFDLNSGLIDSNAMFNLNDSTMDMYIAYNSRRTIHGVVFHNRSNREIAQILGAVFANITSADADTATFSPSLLDVPFDSTRVILLKIDSTTVYKLGNPVEDANGVTFDYSLL